MVYHKRSWIKKISEGVLEKAVDVTLVSIFYGFEFGFTGGKGEKVEAEAFKSLEDFNYQTIRRSFTYLRQKGFIQSVKEELTLPKITAEGKRRLESLIPRYDEKRTWDSRIYLITYDLPIERNNERSYLRDLLKKIGCGMLQQSVWLTPYNPTKLIQEFVEERNLGEDLILVSSLGKGRTIGDWSLEELVERVYDVQELNERYKMFIFEVKKGELLRTQLIFTFLSILKDDPQLPFKLLLEDWAGERAYQLFQKVSSKKIKSKSVKYRSTNSHCTCDTNL